MSKSDRQTEGQLSERPLAELIREVIDAGLSGAIRLSKGPAKVVVYFQKGELVFAASNLRAHRLREVCKRTASAARQVDELSPALSDEELGDALVQKKVLTSAQLQEMRLAQVTEVLRVALLWTEGHWSYDPRVRVESDLRVAIEVDRLLLECARHIPLPFIQSRVGPGATRYLIADVDDVPLSKTETLTLSRISEAAKEVSCADLATRGLREQDSLRGIYALSVAGVIFAEDYKAVLSDGPKHRAVKEPARKAEAPSGPAVADAEVNALFMRLNSAKTHYEVLDVGRIASLSEIKHAYHDLARRFHPDRFHQSELRSNVESAFARIGRAYETLSDQKRRNDYDKSLASKDDPKAPMPAKAAPVSAPDSAKQPETNRAEASFNLGREALERNRFDDAVRYLAEAALLEPRVARYRAYYGSALMRNPNMRRTAEQELQAALKLEPNNASFRVMLAELYQQIGLRKRAENEAARALSADPANASARALLTNLTSK